MLCPFANPVANVSNSSQHCWPNNVRSCCIRSHVALYSVILSVALCGIFTEQIAQCVDSLFFSGQSMNFSVVKAELEKKKLELFKLMQLSRKLKVSYLSWIPSILQHSLFH